MSNRKMADKKCDNNKFLANDSNLFISIYYTFYPNFISSEPSYFSSRFLTLIFFNTDILVPKNTIYLNANIFFYH